MAKGDPCRALQAILSLSISQFEGDHNFTRRIPLIDAYRGSGSKGGGSEVQFEKLTLGESEITKARDARHLTQSGSS